MLLAILVSSCAEPSFSASDYRLKTAHTAKQLAGVVSTAALTAEQASSGRLTRAFAAQALTESLQDASSTLAGFVAVQPPGPSSDRLRRRVSDLGRQTEDVLSDLLTLARRDRMGQLATAAGPLSGLRRQLQALESLGRGLP